MLKDILLIFLRVLFFLNILFAIVIVLNERRNPAATWSWLMVLSFLPYFGFIIYLILGMDSRKHRDFYVKLREDETIYEEYINLNFEGLSYLKQQHKLVNAKNILCINGANHLNDMVYLNYKSAQAAFIGNNDISLFHDGNSKFKELLQDIHNAKSFIHMQYYIVRNDDLGRKIMNALAEKAAKGVEVKLYVDGMGCALNPKKFYAPLIEAGGKVAFFVTTHFVRINFRNHRKLCVIDGCIGYIGGFNIGDEYLGKVKRFGFWRDTHIKIIGDATKELELRFIMDWNYTKRKDKILLIEKYFPNIAQLNSGANVQIVSSGPDTKWPSVHHGYAKMIYEADKNIYIQTPYFVPDDSIFKALRVAALSGLDVRIIIPAHPDHPFVYWASLSYLGELLKSGVRCYQYNKGFIHSKLMVIDGVVTSVGTANMDMRSFDLNFEINAFIYDTGIAEKFEIKFHEDLLDCTEITLEWYNKRSGYKKLKESISRLLSPLL